MCGRFFLDEKTFREILRIVNYIDENLNNKDFSADTYPTNLAPVISKDEGGLRLTEKTWGYPHFNKKGVIINARAESVLEKSLFIPGIHKNRILIPASHFYEWNENKEKNTLTRKDKKIMFMAGFFDTFKGEDRFVILTTKANESMEQIHPRMPLILEEDQISDWVFNDKYLEDFLRYQPKYLDPYAPFKQESMF